MPISITIKDLHKTLGKNQALAGLSLTLEPGVMHGIIGPEGAGKTTLLRSILGLYHPDSGAIHYHEQNRRVRLSDIRDQMAYMPQHQSLYADLSISEHLDFFKSLYHIPDAVYQKRRKELLHITRLEKFTDRSAGQLSGGMYKKLGLMCALLQSPSALFLDEPTNGVDPISRREFWELLFGLASQNILIVLTTAYMDEAERCAKVHLIQRGQLIADGDPKTIIQDAGVSSFDELFIQHETKPI